MDTTEIIITSAGIVLIIAIALFFFIPQKGAAMEAAQHAGLQQQRIIVKGGYTPNVVKLRKGIRAQLIFERHETTSCSDEVVFPDFGIRRMLPAHAETIVEFTPSDAGEFEFACGMNMLHGKLIVE